MIPNRPVEYGKFANSVERLNQYRTQHLLTSFISRPVHPPEKPSGFSLQALEQIRVLAQQESQLLDIQFENQVLNWDVRQLPEGADLDLDPKKYESMRNTRSTPATLAEPTEHIHST